MRENDKIRSGNVTKKGPVTVLIKKWITAIEMSEDKRWVEKIREGWKSQKESTEDQRLQNDKEEITAKMRVRQEVKN